MLSDRSEWRSKKRGHCIRTDLFCNPDIQAAVYQSVFGGDVYLSLEEKVANLLFNEIGKSVFVDLIISNF